LLLVSEFWLNHGEGLKITSNQREPFDRGLDEDVPSSKDAKKYQTKGGAVIMIGPMPIVLGTDARTAKWLMALALALMLLWISGLILQNIRR
jgi:uncharacterized protein (TIGR00304 family)